MKLFSISDKLFIYNQLQVFPQKGIEKRRKKKE